jgi:arylsulfatase A-like enzyme
LQWLPGLISAAGVAMALVTDEQRVVGHPSAASFSQLVNLSGAAPKQPARFIEETELARLFAGAYEALDSAAPEFCLWIHAGSLDRAWDAPREFRERYAEADEPPPPDFVIPPRMLLDENYDPDELWGICQAYAGQVSLLDWCLGGILDWIDENAAKRPTLLVVTAPRGFPLGEHRRVGAWDETLHAELVHVPLLLRFPDGRGAAGRSQALVQPCDVPATLLQWFGLPIEPGRFAGQSLLPLIDENVSKFPRDRAIVVSDRERGIRTPAWYLRLSITEASASHPSVADQPPAAAQLYRKPDDFWEVNDVADRCADVVDALSQVVAELESPAATVQPAPSPVLDEVLVSGVE